MNTAAPEISADVSPSAETILEHEPPTLKLVPLPAGLRIRSTDAPERGQSSGLILEPLNDIQGKSRDEIIVAWLPFVERMLHKADFRSETAREEARGEVHLALVRALDRFEPERGLNLMTYLYPRLHGALADSQRQDSKQTFGITRTVGRALRIIVSAKDKFVTEHGRPPTEEEHMRDIQILNAKLGESSQIPEPLIRELIRDGKPEIVSFDKPEASSSSDPEAPSLKDTVVDPLTPDPVCSLSLARAAHELISAIPNGRAQFALRARFGIDADGDYRDPIKLLDIGKVLGFSESRACQSMKPYLPRIRACLSSVENDAVSLITPKIDRAVADIKTTLLLLPEEQRNVFHLVTGFTENGEFNPRKNPKEAAEELGIRKEVFDSLYEEATQDMSAKALDLLDRARAREEARMYFRIFDSQIREFPGNENKIAA